MEIKNRNLQNFVVTKLNKKISSIEPNELIKIDTLAISKGEIDGEQVYNFDELRLFTSLRQLFITDSLITNEDFVILEGLTKLEGIEFNHCFFEAGIDASKIKIIKKLFFNNCVIDDYSFLKKLPNLEKLYITNPYNDFDIDLTIMNELINLKVLVLDGCLIKNEIELRKLSKLEEISLLKTKTKDLSFLDSLNMLNKMYIDKEYLSDSYVKKDSSRIEVKTSVIDLLFEYDEKSEGKKI